MPVSLRTNASLALSVSVVARSPLWNSAFCRLISAMSACLVTTQNGSKPLTSARLSGKFARSQVKSSCKPWASA